MQKVQKYYIGKNDTLTIMCLKCKRTRKISISDIDTKGQSIRVICPCSHTFFIHLEFRKSFRKIINEHGYYRKTNESTEKIKPCFIKDISIGGLGISISDMDNIFDSDELVVTFKLGLINSAEIKSLIRVSHVNSNMDVGGEFIDDQINIIAKAITYFLL